MPLTESFISPQHCFCKNHDPKPTNDLPLTPPSTETSTPYQTSTHRSPQHSDLDYVAHRLGRDTTKCIECGLGFENDAQLKQHYSTLDSQCHCARCAQASNGATVSSGAHSSPSERHHTRRFSFENPRWPDEDGYLFDVPLLRCQTQDDDATIVSNSTRTQSRSSQTTLCGSLDPIEQMYTTPQKSPLAVTTNSQLPQYPYDKALPPTPPTGRLDFSSPSRLFEDFSGRSRKCSVAGSSISNPICTSPRPSTLRNTSSHERFPSVDDGLQSWVTFVPHREAPKPPAFEEKSGWDSDSEDEEGQETRWKIRRRISEPFRALFCAGKEPRRRSA